MYTLRCTLLQMSKYRIKNKQVVFGMYCTWFHEKCSGNLNVMIIHKVVVVESVVYVLLLCGCSKGHFLNQLLVVTTNCLLPCSLDREKSPFHLILVPSAEENIPLHDCVMLWSHCTFTHSLTYKTHSLSLPYMMMPSH